MKVKIWKSNGASLKTVSTILLKKYNRKRVSKKEWITSEILDIMGNLRRERRKKRAKI